MLGDWNGDRSRDILWYGPAAPPDVLWFGHANGRFTGRAINVAGVYKPFTGDFDADGRRTSSGTAPVTATTCMDGPTAASAPWRPPYAVSTSRTSGTTRRRDPRTSSPPRAAPTTTPGSGTPTGASPPGDHARHRLHPGPAPASPALGIR